MIGFSIFSPVEGLGKTSRRLARAFDLRKDRGLLVLGYRWRDPRHDLDHDAGLHHVVRRSLAGDARWVV